MLLHSHAAASRCCCCCSSTMLPWSNCNISGYHIHMLLYHSAAAETVLCCHGLTVIFHVIAFTCYSITVLQLYCTMLPWSNCTISGYGVHMLLHHGAAALQGCYCSSLLYMLPWPNCHYISGYCVHMLLLHGAAAATVLCCPGLTVQFQVMASTCR